MALCGISLLMHFFTGVASANNLKNKHWAVHTLACFIGITGGECPCTTACALILMDSQ
jgi:hypothetical protein